MMFGWKPRRVEHRARVRLARCRSLSEARELMAGDSVIKPSRSTSDTVQYVIVVSRQRSSSSYLSSSIASLLHDSHYARDFDE